jgi:uncharacterized protein YkwD
VFPWLQVQGRIRKALFAAALAALTAAAPASAAFGPHAVITSGPSGEVASSGATFGFQKSNPSAFGRFECRLDGGPWAGCTSPATYTGLVGGSHRFEVRLVGLLVDPAPALRDWIAALRTETLGCGAARSCDNPVHSVPPTTPRRHRRRDVDGCAYGGNRFGEVTGRTSTRATVCLISFARRRHGLRAVRLNRRLAEAAASHVHDMTRRRYFAHVSRGGSTPADRIRRTGYFRGVRFWAIGEVLAYARRSLRPIDVVRAWLRSPTHRRVLFNPAFRDVGPAAGRGSPRGRGGVTAAAEFGRRG